MQARKEFNLIEMLMGAGPASIMKSEKFSELGAEERSDEPTNSNKNKQAVCNKATEEPRNVVTSSRTPIKKITTRS